MADEPDRDGSDDADEQAPSSTDETPTGDGANDEERRSTDDDDPSTVDGNTAEDDTADDDATDDSDETDNAGDDVDQSDGDETGDDTGVTADETETTRDETADGDGSTDVDAVDLDDVDDASDLNGTSDADEAADADDTDEAADTDDTNETADADEDAFPVAGMTAEDVSWDPDTPTDPGESGDDGDDESAVEPHDDDEVGVQPEKQEISDDFWSDGPESDREMPLADHIEEMMRRLGVVFLVGGVVTLVVLGAAQAIEGVPTAVDIIDALWNHNIPGAPEQADRRPRVYGPLELILTKLKVAGLAGVLVGLPVFVYETYLFMRPGLYPRERRYYLAAVPTSLVLGIVGMTFAHFVVLPAIFSYFTTYTVESATVAFGLAETFNLILLLMGYMAIVFQIPLFIMLAIMMNLVTRVWLEDKRLLFWGAFAGLAFLVSPDPTGMAPIIIAATMIVLYEGTLALLRWTGN